MGSVLFVKLNVYMQSSQFNLESVLNDLYPTRYLPKANI